MVTSYGTTSWIFLGKNWKLSSNWFFTKFVFPDIKAFFKVSLVWIFVTGIFPKFFYYDTHTGFKVEDLRDMFISERVYLVSKKQDNSLSQNPVRTKSIETLEI